MAVVLISLSLFSYSQSTILEARQMPIGTEVTVTGIATNGDEFGIIRYFQDETAGIAAYGGAMDTVNRGDNITISGVLKIYNQLLEIDPITNVIINSTGNPLPEPILLTPSQISETYEGMLVKVNDVIFNDAGQLFTGNNKYEFTANGETGFIYVKNGQNMIGTVIPSDEVNITAICSQFHFSNPNDGYQLLMRDLDDISLTSSIYLTGTLVNDNFTKTTLDFSWSTNINGTTELFYGANEEEFKANHISLGGNNTDHNIYIGDLNPGEITWVQAFSVNGSDTAKSALSSYATISNSGGEIVSYFNTPVDLDYSNGVDAIYLDETIDDTLIKYIERAKYTIDFTIYNFNNDGISNISDALISAANSGVRVRVIGCGTTDNEGIDELIGTAVNVLVGPDGSERTGIMHNKFIVFDAQSEDPNDPLVWTGSTNFTDGQINLDANDVIIVQDQSLARTYEIEFEEMWGSHGDEPNPENSLFGSEKRNNTPHEFMIGGKYIECYFSPSDGVNDKIVEVINTADNDLSIATMLMTRIFMAEAIADRKTAGVDVNVITNAEGNNNTTVNSILTESLTTHYTFDDVSQGILHTKYMIVDQYPPLSDPMLLTGTHNWSAAADNDNDENTLIIHDATITNVYYQQFVHRFVENLGVLIELTDPPIAIDDMAETQENQIVTVTVLDNDIIQAPVTMSIEEPGTMGNTFIPFANPNAISYVPETGFIGLDSIVYKIEYKAEPSFYAMAKVYVNVTDESSITEIIQKNSLTLSPNPAKNIVTIELQQGLDELSTVTVFDLMGKQKLSVKLEKNQQNVQLNLENAGLKQGIYIVAIKAKDTVFTGRIVLCD